MRVFGDEEFVKYLLSMNWSVMDLFEDLEDEHDEGLVRQVREA
jgi:hypothetical protein